MKLVMIYSSLLLIGILFSQVFDFSAIRDVLNTLTMTSLAYIMIHVGLEFFIDKKNLKSYGWDYVVAMTAAAFPWIFCAAYFIFFFKTPLSEALLLGRFAAPTSAGVLFAMLVAAGLGATWFFKKVRILAIFDDLDTILLMIPLKMILVGFKPELIFIVFIMGILLWLAYKYLHVLRIPTGNFWIFFYGLVIVVLCELLEHSTKAHLEVLLPAFVLGCVIYHAHNEKVSKISAGFDQAVKGLFMLLVGCSLPKIVVGDMQPLTLAAHVMALTVLSNLGKCFPSFCYRKEAPLKERVALSVAMFPRGEVGAGVLLVAVGYGFTGTATTVAGLSLALNLVLTAVFIQIVIRLMSQKVLRGDA